MVFGGMNVELVAGIELPVPVVLVVGGIWFAVLVIFCAVRTTTKVSLFFCVVRRLATNQHPWVLRPFRNRQERRAVLPENSHVVCV